MGLSAMPSWAKVATGFKRGETTEQEAALRLDDLSVTLDDGTAVVGQSEVFD